MTNFYWSLLENNKATDQWKEDMRQNERLNILSEFFQASNNSSFHENFVTNQAVPDTIKPEEYSTLRYPMALSANHSGVKHGHPIVNSNNWHSNQADPAVNLSNWPEMTFPNQTDFPVDQNNSTNSPVDQFSQKNLPASEFDSPLYKLYPELRRARNRSYTNSPENSDPYLVNISPVSNLPMTSFGIFPTGLALTIPSDRETEYEKIGKSNVRFVGDCLKAMMKNWNLMEIENGRRVVEFMTIKEDSLEDGFKRDITANCRPFCKQDTLTPGNFLVSCIKMNPDRDSTCLITSTDLILALGNILSVEFTNMEKNRIRRNLEYINPITIHKIGDNASLFRRIMQYSSPSARKIEKDIKVYEWACLEKVIKKVTKNFIPSPSSICLY